MANLIGTKPNQVPTNGSLGTMAFQDADNVSDVTFMDTVGAENLSLTAIAQTKAESAVDVFVYDTSKDSDGGAWRQRTQGTSWYNEPLNTATRGSRKEFPAVAVIVAESTKVTIYDGDDPSLPMWMVYENAGVLSWTTSATTTMSAVSALNGLVTISNQEGLVFSSFVSDEMYPAVNNLSFEFHDKRISKRNGVVDASVSSGNPIIIVKAVNDIAMTVLPDAPIDPATGLPIPTIAVATAGGVSVIKDDGSVVDITNSDVNNARAVEFLDNNKIACHLYDSRRGVLIFTIPEEDLTRGVHYSKGVAEEWYEGYFNAPSAQVGDLKLIPSSYSNLTLKNHIAEKEDVINIANLVGLNTIKRNLETPTEGMIAHTTSTYNTGWMNGDIKLATLSDTDDTDLVGSELVTNGTFDTDTSGWTTTSATFTSASGEGLLTSDGSSQYGYANASSVPVVVGKTYVFSGTYRSGTANGTRIVLSGATSRNTGADNASTTAKTLTVSFVAQTTSLSIQGLVYSADSTSRTGYFDNVSVRLAEADRSVNNNGLQVFGTVQKNPVATGADLVAYSGFGGSNYLEQPYNSDLDFGTGDFCVMGWFKMPASISNEALFYRGYYDGSAYIGPLILVNLDTSGYPKISIYTDPSTSANLDTANYTTPLDNNQWTFISGVRSGNSLKLYINGSLVDDHTITSVTGSLDNSQATVRLGLNHSTLFSNRGSMALWRVSGTAPTAEQIAKIYEDEKVLFQENAKCTLHGTSDSVTALAYDEGTDLLHVGTSSGRSDFKGLRRVNNTTDAVGVAISASNNLVVEE